MPVGEALRPMTLGELLDRTFFLYRRHFGLFVGIAALPNLALLAVQLLNIAIRPQTAIRFSVTLILTGLVTLLVYLAVYLVALAVTQGATVIAVSRLHLGEKVSISDAFAGIKGRVATLALTMIAVGIGVAFATVLVIVPGIIVALMWSLAIPVAVLERNGPSASLSRSSALTKGSRGRIFVVYVLFIVLTYILYSLWEIPIFVAIGLFSGLRVATGFPVWTQIAFAVGQFLTQCVVGPMLTIALSLVYYDQRVRKEAFDLQHMMAQLDGTATA